MLAILASSRSSVTWPKSEYDDRDNLVREYQSHGGAVGPSTPAVQCAWSYQPYDPTSPADPTFDRLTGMVYPVRPDDGWQRVLAFNYGNNAGDLDSRLDRVTQILDGVTRSGNTPNPSPVANYTCMGTSRRVGMKLGDPTTPAVQQTFAGGDGYTGFDRYGRIKDLHFKKSVPTPATIHQYTYAYDVAGNRISSRVIQAPTPGTPDVPHNNDRSYKYTYDPFKVGPLGSAILNGGSVSDEELDRIWCKYAGVSHRPC